jgi:hypothetical protein
MHGEFLRLLFLQAHRETEAHFTAAGMPSQRNQSESFRFKRAAFYQGLKIKVGLAAAKAAALRINLNVQGCSIVAAPMHAPSRTSLLLPLLLSHNLPLPRVHLMMMMMPLICSFRNKNEPTAIYPSFGGLGCVMGSLVHTGLGSSFLVAHVLPYPPPPPRQQLCTRSCSNKHTHTVSAS